MLNLDPTMALVAREAKRQGVRSLGEGVYAFLSLAAEAHLTDLMHSLVKTRLQREDLGKWVPGVWPNSCTVGARGQQGGWRGSCVGSAVSVQWMFVMCALRHHGEDWVLSPYELSWWVRGGAMDLFTLFTHELNRHLHLSSLISLLLC